MQRKNVHLLGLSETHWKGQGHFTSDLGSTVYFSGPEDDSSRGVAFIVPHSLNKCVLGYKSVSDRIITLKINTDSKWEYLKRMIEETARNNKLVKPVMKDFITPETARTILERRELKENGICSTEDQQRYAELSRQVQLQCRKDHDNHINRICLEIEQHALKNESRYLFQKVKELTGTRKLRTCAIEDKDGSLLTNVAQVLERWKNYCAELYDTVEPNDDNITWAIEEPDILLSEIEHAIKALKYKKSPGKDAITADVLKNLGQRGTKAITEICNTIWSTGRWPKDWTESVFIPLHKKSSSKNCGNYRTIALISHASKILLHIINRRLNYFLSRQIPEEQAGFVKGRGTREQILNVRQIIEKSREFNSPVVLCFIDYTKAFDCVQWNKLWNVLLEMGAPEHLVALIQSLYTENRSFIRIDSECSNMFQTKKGVRQGCILSPALFNIYGEYIIRRTIESWEKGFPIGGKRLSNLRYADDTILLATSMEDMSELFERLELESRNIGLAVNRNKTKVMIVDRAGKLENVTCNIPGINIVDRYIYLGSQICNDGSCVPEIKRRIGMAKDAMTRLNNIWKKRGIGIKTKIRLIRALVFPIFLYGVETWTILARERQRIDAFEMWCWRRMLRIPWTAKRTNASILTQLRIQTRLSTICQQRILSYFGHTVRRGDENLEKLIVVGNTEGKRSRGRSPTRWTDQVKDSSSSKFYMVMRDALDRNRWRQIIRSRCYPTADHDPQT